MLLLGLYSCFLALKLSQREGAAPIQVSSCMGWYQGWRQLDETTTKYRLNAPLQESLGKCAVLAVAAPLGVSRVCVTPFSRVPVLSCSCLFGPMLYSPDLAVLCSCLVIFPTSWSAVDQETGGFCILAWPRLRFVFSSLLEVISCFHHSLSYMLNQCCCALRFLHLKGRVPPDTFIFPSSKTFLKLSFAVIPGFKDWFELLRTSFSIEECFQLQSLAGLICLYAAWPGISNRRSFAVLSLWLVTVDWHQLMIASPHFKNLPQTRIQVMGAGGTNKTQKPTYHCHSPSVWLSFCETSCLC